MTCHTSYSHRLERNLSIGSERGGPGVEMGARFPKFDVWVRVTLRICGHRHRSVVKFCGVTRLKKVLIESHVIRLKLVLLTSILQDKRQYS